MKKKRVFLFFYIQYTNVNEETYRKKKKVHGEFQLFFFDNFSTHSKYEK